MQRQAREITIHEAEDMAAYADAIRDEHGEYVLIEPWSAHLNLRWPFASWIALVAALRAQHVTVLQHVHARSTTVPGVHGIVLATFRQACALIQRSSVYVRGESGLLHAAAALGARTVAIWGGCMDWDVLGGYPGQIGVGVQSPVCGRWLPCDHCRQIMAAISVDDVLSAILATLRQSRAA